ncbi:hypothetical protein CBR_g68694 [Chara braunii]|uniref:Uncharacterized protein n=1 Tax=Chara braunii TaxID=69332 RepID=A0A388K9I9_CHABU|nr:hypothetical protein CBR_g68694 [Chara braunii]|eukprot:GBG66710.1 hypothetical protein CBR_g68694 [Chara braunii]
MADMHRRSPLLVLAVVVFLFVVFLHVCLSCRPWKQRRKRTASTKRQAGERPMAGMQARTVLAAGQGGKRPATTEPRWRYDPSMYTHLESWETPLPQSDEEPETKELPTLPLASGSTQLLSQTVRAGGSASNEGGEFTSLLHQCLGDDDDRGLDLMFGLCYGGAREASRTFIIDADPSPRGLQRAGSEHIKQSTLRGGVSITGGVGPSAAARQHGSTAPSAGRLTSTWPSRTRVASGSLRIGDARPSMPNRTTPAQPELRDEGARTPPVHPGPTVENITRGVSNMRVHSDGDDDDGGSGDDADEGLREDVETWDDDDDIPIQPLGKTGGRWKGRNRGAVRGRSVGRDDRGGVSDNAWKSVTFWVQLPRRGAVGRESIGSEAGGDGCPEERSSARDSDNNARSGAGGGKRKNARKQALELIVDVMDRHGELMSATIDSSSKRQCSIFTRQCDILEQEVAVQKAHYAVSDETQRMMCHALMEIAAADRGRSPIGPDKACLHEGLPMVRSATTSLTTAQGKEEVGGMSRRRRGRVSRYVDDAPASVPPRRAQGWAAAAEGDYDDNFTREEEQAEAIASAVQESARQRSPDQSASKRMLTPPPEARQLRARDTRTEKVLVVDLAAMMTSPWINVACAVLHKAPLRWRRRHEQR